MNHEVAAARLIRVIVPLLLLCLKHDEKLIPSILTVPLVQELPTPRIRFLMAEFLKLES